MHEVVSERRRAKVRTSHKEAGDLHAAGLLDVGFSKCGATGYYRVGYQPDAVRALAGDAESKLSPAERIALQTDIWASVRVGREPVGDYLALAQGLGSDRNRAVLEDVLARLNYIGQYLVTDSDRESYRIWLRQYLAPILKDVGWESKAGRERRAESAAGPGIPCSGLRRPRSRGAGAGPQARGQGSG